MRREKIKYFGKYEILRTHSQFRSIILIKHIDNLFESNNETL